MMNVLFLTLVQINDFSQTGIYPDLIKEFAKHGQKIYVITPCENKNKSCYEPLREKDNVYLIQARIPDYFGVGLVQKGISSLLIGRRYLQAINHLIPNVKFDLILYSTPPITFCGLIEKIKRRDGASTYLLLKDIWPQGMVDIGVLSTKGIKGLITKYFENKEKKLYILSDRIGCMSQANVDYVKKNNRDIEHSIVEICPNSIDVIDKSVDYESRVIIRNKYGIPIDKTVFVYGGNLGKAQAIPFLIRCLKVCADINDAFFLIIGDGTEYGLLENYKKLYNQGNLKLIRRLPKDEYDTMVGACDVGLIFLDHRFTIPNFPSRLLSYMSAKLPVLACTDSNTDIGQTIVDGGFGWWCESDDETYFRNLICRVITINLSQMGTAGYEYLCKYYTTEKTVETILNGLNVMF